MGISYWQFAIDSLRGVPIGNGLRDSGVRKNSVALQMAEVSTYGTYAVLYALARAPGPGFPTYSAQGGHHRGIGRAI